MSTAFPIIPDPRYRIATATSNQTAFTVPFPFLQAEDITVFKTGLDGVMVQLARPANYNISGAGSPAGGTVTLKTGAKAGEVLLIQGAAIRSRSNSVVRGGKYNSAAMDEDLDRLTLYAQELDREIARTAKVPYGEAAPLVTVGAPGTLAVWDDEGNLVEGPTSAAIEAVDVALGVAAGRSLVYPASPAAPKYDAGSRIIENVADGAAAHDAVNKGQLDALEAAVGVPAIEARFTAIETSAANNCKTGDLKLSLFDDDQTGWLPVDDRTIGDASSGATSRANADTQALFLKMWAKYDNTLCPIQTSAGAASVRGANAAADYAAHKRLPLLAIGGEFLRFLDRGRGVDSGRVLGSAQAELIKNHGHALTMNALGTHSHTTTTNGSRHGAAGVNLGGSIRGSDGDNTANSSNQTSTSSSVSAGTPAGTVGNNTGGGAETRPRNIAFPLFVKL